MVDHHPIRAALIGGDHCAALGFVARGSVPVLALCRKLIAAGYDPALPLHAYRGDTLALKVCSRGEGGHLWETYGVEHVGIDSRFFGYWETLEEKRL